MVDSLYIVFPYTIDPCIDLYSVSLCYIVDPYTIIDPCIIDPCTIDPCTDNPCIMFNLYTILCRVPCVY